jgi:hypothetical protein
LKLLGTSFGNPAYFEVKNLNVTMPVMELCRNALHALGAALIIGLGSISGAFEQSGNPIRIGMSLALTGAAPSKVINTALEIWRDGAPIETPPVLIHNPATNRETLAQVLPQTTKPNFSRRNTLGTGAP